ncbi:hypothetical protein DHEL01_v204055 [Diaporthe helianthi]|uniref:Uncharacterized protein n=1 Tax=Diaporthe helianthi TaxID=158607 RepID=A0A2P5I4Y3_DIAHE|nr:hypothetical protein DHEL01_v204055 [Diaporthe helianthi]
MPSAVCSAFRAMMISKSGNDGLNLAALYLAQYMAEEGDFWFGGGDKDTLDGHADPADPSHPEPLFVHTNLLKHMSGVRPGDVFPLLRRLAPGQDDVGADYYPTPYANERQQCRR